VVFETDPAVTTEIRGLRRRLTIILSPTRHKLRPILASNELGRTLLPELSPIELSNIQDSAHQSIGAAVIELYKATRKLRKRCPRPIGLAVDERLGSEGWSANHQLVCNKICSFC
jgi:hypothetical protein